MDKADKVARRAIRQFGLLYSSQETRYVAILAEAIRAEVKAVLEQAWELADKMPCATGEQLRVAATIAQAIRKLMEEVK
jgi:hypothetical protein